MSRLKLVDKFAAPGLALKRYRENQDKGIHYEQIKCNCGTSYLIKLTRSRPAFPNRYEETAVVEVFRCHKCGYRWWLQDDAEIIDVY